MSKENDEKRKREREEYIRRKKERWDAILALPNEKITAGIISGLTSEEFKTLLVNKEGFAHYYNNVLFAAPVPPKQ